jgi:hypothetical protein
MAISMSSYGKSEKKIRTKSFQIPSRSGCVPHLERLLGSLAAGADGLGVKLEVGPTRVHVVQMCTVLVKPEMEFLIYEVDKRLESFAPCFSESLLLADFTENYALLWL